MPQGKAPATDILHRERSICKANCTFAFANYPLLSNARAKGVRLSHHSILLPLLFCCGDLLEVCARFFGRSAGHGESFQSKSPRDSIAPLCHSGGNGVTDRISKGTQGQLQNDTLRCPWRRNRISADIHTDDARNLCHLSNHASREVIPYGITSKDLAWSINFDLSVC